MGSRNRYSRSISRSMSASRSPRRSKSRGGRRYRSPPRSGRGYNRSPRDNYRSRSPRYGRGNPAHENQDHQVYVARFQRRTTEGELKRAFEKYGQVEKIDLKDGRGFGFIYFRNKRDAEDAIDGMNGRSLPYCDERLVVERAGLKSRRTRDREATRRRSRSRGDRGEDVCYNCNRTGHYARECRERNTTRDAERERKITEGRCFICNEKGHKKIDCPVRASKGLSSRRDQHDRRGSRSPFSRSMSRRKGRDNRSRSFSRSNSRSRSPRSRYSKRNSDSLSKHSPRGENDEERKRGEFRRRDSRSKSGEQRGRDGDRSFSRGSSRGYGRKKKHREDRRSQRSHSRSEERLSRRRKTEQVDFEDETDAHTANLTNQQASGKRVLNQKDGSRGVQSQKSFDSRGGPVDEGDFASGDGGDGGRQVEEQA